MTKEEKREYMREWRKKNREHVNAYLREYHQKNRDVYLAKKRAWSRADYAKKKAASRCARPESGKENICSAYDSTEGVKKQ